MKKKAPKSTKSFDIESWAKGWTKPPAPCGTCADPRWVEAIATVHKLMKGGKSCVSLRALHEMMVEKLDYGLGRNAIERHIERCIEGNGKAPKKRA